MNFCAKPFFRKTFFKATTTTKATYVIIIIVEVIVIVVSEKMNFLKDCNAVNIGQGKKIGQDGFGKEGAFSFLSLSIFFAQKYKGQGTFMKRYTLACSFQPSSCRHAFQIPFLSMLKGGKFIRE